MRSLAVALVLVLVLSGATCQHKGDAPVADAPPECYRALFPSAEDTGVRWTCDAEDAACWDELGKIVLPELVRRGLGTERARQACAGFITDLKQRGVIRAKE